MEHIKSQLITHKLQKCPKSTVFLNYTGGPFAHTSLTLLNHSGKNISSFHTMSSSVLKSKQLQPLTETCTKSKSVRPAELRVLIDHKLLYINAYVGTVSVCEQLWCLLCPWLVWLVCLCACNVFVSAFACLCGFLYRDSPAEKTCSLYVNMRPVYCMRSLNAALISLQCWSYLWVSGKHCRGIVSTCSVVLTTSSGPPEIYTA